MAVAFLATFFVAFLAVFFAAFLATFFVFFAAPASARARSSPTASSSVSAAGSLPRGTVAFTLPSVTYDAVTALEHPHGLAVVGVLAELGERRLLLTTAPHLRLRVERLGFGHGDREQLVFRRQGCGCRRRTASGTGRTGPATPGSRGLRCRCRPTRGRLSSCSASSRVTRLGGHRREQRRPLRFLLRALLLLAELHVRAEATRSARRWAGRSRGRSPSERGPSDCLAISSSASGTVSSSGAMSGGSDAVSLSSRCTYGP